MTSQLDKSTLTKRFLELAEGNWRNSFYIDCSSCPYERPEACGTKGSRRTGSSIRSGAAGS